MTSILKTAAVAVISTGLIATAVAVPQSASAYTHYVCRYEQKHDEHTGTIIGAVAGGLIGNSIAGHARLLGTVGGAVAGGAIGSKIGHDHGKSVCEREVAYRERVVYRDHGREKVVYRYVRQ
jgi:uncharacterized protein YcfJ